MSREKEARAERARTASRIRRLWGGGMSEENIAEATCTTRRFVLRALKRVKASPKKVQARRERIRNNAQQQRLDRLAERRARAERRRIGRRIIRLWHGGMSEKKIAEATSTTRQLVLRALKRVKASPKKVKRRTERIRNKARQRRLERPAQRRAQRLRNAGWSIANTARAVGRGKTWVLEWTGPRKRKRKPQKEQLVELREAYRSGVAIAELKRFFKANWETIDKALQGEARRGRGGPTRGKPARQAMTAGNVRRLQRLRRATWENERGPVPRGGHVIAIRRNLPEEYQIEIWNLALVSLRTNTTLGRRAAKARREGHPIAEKDRREAIRKTAEELGDKLFAFGIETTPPETPDGSSAGE